MGREVRGETAELGGEAAHVIRRLTILLRHPGHDHARAPELGQSLGDGRHVVAQSLDALMGGDGAQPRRVQKPGERRRRDLGQSGELDGPVAGRRHRLEGPGQVLGHQSAHGVELERDLVMSHPRTIGHPTDVASAP